MWRNAVECIVEVTGASLQQTVAQIISAMDGDTMYRAQNVLTELKQTLRGQAIANPINTIPELLDRLDRVLNKVGETDRAKLRLETLKQRPYETTADYFQECSNLWARANQGSANRPEGQLISSFLGGLLDGTIARLARMRVRESPGLSANKVCNLVLSYEIGLREQDIEEKKKNDSTNHELMRNFDEAHRRELQALKFRNHQAGEPMEIDTMQTAPRRRSVADLNAIQPSRSTGPKTAAMEVPSNPPTEERGPFGLNTAEVEHLLHHWAITHGGYEVKKRDSEEEKKPAVEDVPPQAVEGSQAVASVQLRNPLRPWNGVDRDVWTWRNEVIHSLSVTGGSERQKCGWVVELITGPVREPINHIINDVYMSNNPTVLGKPAVEIKDSVQLLDLIADTLSDVGTVSDARVTFVMRFQGPSESSKEFFYKLRNLWTKAYGGAKTAHKELVGQFFKGLRNEAASIATRKLVLDRPGMTPEDVQKNVEHYETAERLHRAESRPHASSRTTRPPSSDVGAVGEHRIYAPCTPRANIAFVTAG
ncbi:Hypothetical protein FKW44_007395 [Caligus rogercresseyi]|uniref:Uncharacterized protein n=1 Tax=Caligus rogercresseyi TaxID=217165 RepID=A0A7T8KEU0_CALRO|nr:Hypothetical protein FKW44_007395 [Caligus rogercresseyi]